MNARPFSILLSALMLSAAWPAAGRGIAATDAVPVGVTGVVVEVDGAWLNVAMSVDRRWSEKNREVRLTPVIVSADGRDSLRLQAVVVAGHVRYVRHERRGTADTTALYYHAGEDDPVAYAQRIEIRPWMEQSTLYLRRDVAGCCARSEAAVTTPVADLDLRPRVFEPTYVYARPVAADVKERHIDGQAYIDFVVNTIDYRPDYRRNPEEMAKIVASIDTVRTDPDCSIARLSFRGYASPEGSYKRNTWLAQGRTATLSRYVRNLYHYPDSIVTIDYEPEDWAGLRAYVASSGLAHRDEILHIIDSDLDPDDKDRRIRAAYPDEYAMLLAVVYPGLRRCDYRISYTVRHYLDPAEILRVMHTAPQKLDLDEFYLAAATLPEGSVAYHEVFEIAVRMFPADPVANLNAANSAMSVGDLARAETYLARAGTDAEATYARAILAARRGDFDTARDRFARAVEMGFAPAADAIATLDATAARQQVTYRIE